MAIETASLLSYGDTSVKESVLEMITLLTAEEDFFLNSLARDSAVSTVHSVQTDTLLTAASLAVAEGSQASLSTLSAPSRVTNLMEIVRKDYAVSGTQRAVSHYGFGDQFAYQTQKALKDWANAAEFDIVRSTLVSGVSGTAPKMNGIIAAISTNLTAQTSGTVFAESIFNGLIGLTWENSNGNVAGDIFGGSSIKQDISGFAGRTGSQTITKDMTTAVKSIDFYISDYGSHRIHLHRYVQQSGDATDRLLGVNMDSWALAFLREPRVEDLAKTGDTTRAMIVGELTVEPKNETTSFFASGYLK
jgi:hypothetical protein